MGGWLGGNDPRYSKSCTFDPFPFSARSLSEAHAPQSQRLPSKSGTANSGSV